MTLLLRAGVVACLLGGGLLTGLRLLQPDHGLLIRLVALTPWAVPAYLLALAVLVLLVGVDRAGARTPAAAAAVVACLGLVLHLGWLAPQVAGDGAEPGADAVRLRVMTANMLLGDADPEDLVQLAADEDVDLLAVQEVTPYALLMMEEAGLNEQLPYHAGEPLYGVEGTMLYSRHPLTGERPVPTRWTSFRVRAEVAGERLSVLVTHPESPMGDASGWRQDHRVLAEAVAGSPPDLLVGDLNATPDHAAFHALLDAGLRDAAEVAGSGWQPTWPAPGSVGRGPLSVPPAIAIDHVLVGDGWSATATRTHVVRGTDHSVLVADVVRD